MRRWLRRIFLVLLLIAGLCGTYIGTAALLTLWPAHADAPSAPAEVEVEAYVLSNGVHTDLLLPIRSAVVDWTQIFPLADAPAPSADAAFVAIGWGDREFYLNTPQWADLTFSRALGALTGGNAALLHVTWLSRAQVRRGAYAVPLSTTQYGQLAAYVIAMLPTPRAVQIAGAHYGREDAFYEAMGSYNAFETCNTWTGRGLRQAGVTTGRWTPFEQNVIWHLRPAVP